MKIGLPLLLIAQLSFSLSAKIETDSSSNESETPERVKIASVWKSIPNEQTVTIRGDFVSQLSGYDIMLQDKTGLLIVDARKKHFPKENLKSGDYLEITGQVIKPDDRLSSFQVTSVSLLKPNAATDDELFIFGEAEHAVLNPQGIQFKARLDTGAQTSSMSALDIVNFERDSKKWVRFNIVNPQLQTKVMIEAPLTRVASIKRHGAEDQKRPVVKLDLSIGKLRRKIEFTLTDRSKYEFPVLIGRNFLSGAALIDVSEAYTTDEILPATSAAKE